ncbi:MAG: glutamate racemase [Nitrospirae bacterium]|nr:glutamate racemase [Nitrospirota bacterium]
MNDAPIGIFDSGMGGLTVMKAIVEEMPSENTVYLGDTARVPYGIRSRETILRYSFECMSFMLKHNIKLLVIACNTVSAISLGAIRKKSPVPVIGVIGPGARAAVKYSNNRKIGVIGTEATIRSSSYLKAIKAIDRRACIYSMACPLFVPLVEEGWVKGDIAKLTAKRYLDGLKGKGIDALLLGCTHYPLLKGTLSEVMGDSVTLIDSAIETAKEIKVVLKKHSLLRKGKRKPFREFYVTDSPERFGRLGKMFLGHSMENMKVVRLDMEV